MGKHLSDFDKGRAVAYDDVGKTHRWIAEKIGSAKTTISRIIRKHKRSHTHQRRHGTGTVNRKTSVRGDRQIVRSMLRKRTISSKEIKHNLNLTISSRTVRRRLNEAGYGSHFKLKKNFVNRRNRRKRVRWCRDHKDWTHQQWMKVLWSDESPFFLRYKGRVRVWRRPNERYARFCTTGTIKYDKKINVWGCFSGNGVGHLHKVHGILEQRQYKQILIHHMIPSARDLFPANDWIFQQDNDPKHTARSVQNWLNNTRRLNVMQWPAQSPDLNPIENLWAILDGRLCERRCSNTAELLEVLKAGWAQIPNVTLVNLVRSMPKRCKLVIKSRGYPIKY